MFPFGRPAYSAAVLGLGRALGETMAVHDAIGTFTINVHLTEQPGQHLRRDIAQ